MNKFIVQNASNRQVLGVLKALMFPISQKRIQQNQTNNLSELKKHTFFMGNTFIENQREWKNVKFGRADMDKAGCEIIATYNAKLALGETTAETDMVELISTYENRGAVLLGNWGTAPMAIYDYFVSQRYETAMEMDFHKETIHAMKEKYETFILSFFNDENRVSEGIHTINISKNGRTYSNHNVYKRNMDGYISDDGHADLWDAVLHVNVPKKSKTGECVIVHAKPISIIGINRKGKENTNTPVII